MFLTALLPTRGVVPSENEFVGAPASYSGDDGFRGGRRWLDGDGIGGKAMWAALAENRGGEKDDDAGTVIIQNFHRDPFGQLLPACLLVASSLAGVWRQPAGNFTAAARRRRGAVLCLLVASSHVAAVAIDGYFEMHRQGVTS